MSQSPLAESRPHGHFDRRRGRWRTLGLRLRRSRSGPIGFRDRGCGFRSNRRNLFGRFGLGRDLVDPVDLGLGLVAVGDRDHRGEWVGQDERVVFGECLETSGDPGIARAMPAPGVQAGGFEGARRSLRRRSDIGEPGSPQSDGRAGDAPRRRQRCTTRTGRETEPPTPASSIWLDPAIPTVIDSGSGCEVRHVNDDCRILSTSSGQRSIIVSLGRNQDARNQSSRQRFALAV